MCNGLLSRFGWYRRWKGGKWGYITGMFGRHWLRLPDDAAAWDEWWYNWHERRQRLATLRRIQRLEQERTGVKHG